MCLIFIWLFAVISVGCLFVQLWQSQASFTSNHFKILAIPKSSQVLCFNYITKSLKPTVQFQL